MGNSSDSGDASRKSGQRPPNARLFLDHNATSPIRPEALVAASAAMTLGGNPSSVHGEGRAARKLVEDSREAVARLVGALPRNLIFTGSGTEALNLALSPGLREAGDPRPFSRLLLSAVEHVAVLDGHRFPPNAVTVLPVDGNGLVDLAALERLLAEPTPGRTLVALMAANNETGVIQPVAAAAELVHANGGLLVVDGVQALGKMPLSLQESGADLLALSGHKIGAPTGIGALVLAREEILVEPLTRGGGQERRRRAGTENLSGIAGFGAAARLLAADPDHASSQATLRENFERAMRGHFPDAVFFGADVPRLPNTSCVAVPSLTAETMLIAFDLAGIAVSSGSACSSGSVKASHVLDSMGVPPDLMRCAVRISIGPDTLAGDLDRAFRVWVECGERRARLAVAGRAA